MLTDLPPCYFDIILFLATEVRLVLYAVGILSRIEEIVINVLTCTEMNLNSL